MVCTAGQTDYTFMSKQNANDNIKERNIFLKKILISFIIFRAVKSGNLDGFNIYLGSKKQEIPYFRNFGTAISYMAHEREEC